MHLRPTTNAIDGEQVPAGSLLAGLVSVNAARMHGEPCFAGTRVPVRTLFDHLTLPGGLDEFLLGFPDVSREQAGAIIELAAHGLLDGLRRA
jgi:uncharacterized protein (DUF433 family)